MLCVTLVAQIVDRPTYIHGDGGTVVVCRLRPLDSPDCNWRIETPLNDVSAPLLDLRPGATVFVQGEFVAENREREGFRWREFPLAVDRVVVIDRGREPARVSPVRAPERTLTTRAVARALGGEVVGRKILAPGPGHSAADRSLSIRLEPTAPDGFLVYSFAGDDWIACRRHVRARLGIGPVVSRHEQLTPIQRSAPEEEDEARRAAFIRQQIETIVRDLVPLRGTPGEQYIRRETAHRHRRDRRHPRADRCDRMASGRLLQSARSLKAAP